MPSPAYSFGGRGIRRDLDSDGFAKLEPTPGPGSYILERSTGKQCNSRRITLPQTKFPVSSRAQAAKVFAGTTTLGFVCSPGPGAYRIESQIGVTSSDRSTAAFGRQRGEQRIERLRPSTTPGPGPGDYVNKQSSCRASTFGSAMRKSVVGDRQYPGPGMPVYSRPEGANASYAAQTSSLGMSASRPTSPAFSFAGREQTAPRKRVNTAELTSTPHSKRGASHRRSQRGENDLLSRAKMNANKYSWLTGRTDTCAATVRQMVQRSNEWRAPSFSFSRDLRFSDSIYMPHKPLARSTETPGPIYELNSRIDSPQYSFARDEMPESISRHCQTPGPGTYNIRLEHRMEAILSQVAYSKQNRPTSRPKTSHEMRQGNVSHKQMFQRARDDTHISHSVHNVSALDEQLAMLSATDASATALALGIKFGDIPTRPRSPAYSFGSGDREIRAKLYNAGDLNKEMAGKLSPGPQTADANMARMRTSQWRGAPNFSFGGNKVQRDQGVKPATDVGPAQFGRLDSIGTQTSSMLPTSPKFGFGSAARSNIDRQFAPYDPPPQIPSLPSAAADVPGPMYLSDKLGVSSIGRQLSSSKTTEPQCAFSKALRDKEAKLFMPQPSSPVNTANLRL